MMKTVVPYDTWHAQTEVTYPFTKQELQVDSELAELLQLVWAKGIKTVQSCCGLKKCAAIQHMQLPSDEYAYIAFERQVDMASFLSTVCETRTPRKTRVTTMKDMFKQKAVFNKGLNLYFTRDLIDDFTTYFK